MLCFIHTTSVTKLHQNKKVAYKHELVPQGSHHKCKKVLGAANGVFKELFW